MLLSDFENTQRPLRLRPPIAIGWNFNRAEGIMLNP